MADLKGGVAGGSILKGVTGMAWDWCDGFWDFPCESTNRYQQKIHKISLTGFTKAGRRAV